MAKRRGTKDSFCNNSTEIEAATDRGALSEGGLYSLPASAHLLTTIVVVILKKQASDKVFPYRRLQSFVDPVDQFLIPFVCF